MEIISEVIHASYLFCILQYRDDKVWVKIEDPCTYEHFTEKAENIFPSLKNTNFIFTDENDAILQPEILLEFIRINPRGVIVKIKTTNVDTSLSQVPKEISQSSTSSDIDACSIIISDNLSDNLYEHEENIPSSSKKSKLNTTVCESNEVISKEKLHKIIKESACGQEILDNYNQNKYLSEKYRKLVVKIVAQSLLEYTL